jgi:hypothetical protein
VNTGRWITEGIRGRMAAKRYAAFAVERF